MNRSHWQLPDGVPRGIWDYVHNPSIADDYDEYFADCWLFDLDEPLILNLLQQHPAGRGALVADLGCGTGRALVGLARAGFRGLAVDLSRRMLEIVREKAALDQLDIECLQANLVHLDGIADASVDHCLSLFSTLGMIRGRAHRRQALAHVRRILKPGGWFLLHVHNYWFNLYDPGGPRWLAANAWRTLWKRDCELGDKFYPYRGISNMFLHVFRRREIEAELRWAGLKVRRAWCLDPRRRSFLRFPRLGGNWRTSGWLLACS